MSYSPGWPQTCCVAGLDLELTLLPLSLPCPDYRPALLSVLQREALLTFQLLIVSFTSRALSVLIDVNFYSEIVFKF